MHAEWNIIGSMLFPLMPSTGNYTRNMDILYPGFSKYPTRQNSSTIYQVNITQINISEMACGLIIVERKYQTAMMNTVIPLIFIGWLGVAGGLIPTESGEKMSFLITVTLALVFITTQIDQNLAPAGRRSLPLISWLVLGNYLILGQINELYAPSNMFHKLWSITDCHITSLIKIPEK